MIIMEQRLHITMRIIAVKRSHTVIYIIIRVLYPAIAYPPPQMLRMKQRIKMTFAYIRRNYLHILYVRLHLSFGL